MKFTYKNHLKSEISYCKYPVFITILVLIPLIIMLIVVELFLKHQEEMQIIPMYRNNPYGNTSYRLKPNFYCKRIIGDHEIQIHTNQHGMHWYPVDQTSTSDNIRLAFVGDSFTFGCWADDFQHSFVSVFDSLVRVNGYEALNFGVGGYGLDDIELILKEQVCDFSPSYVVLMFFNGNDFRDTYLGTNKYDYSNGICQWNWEVIEHKLPIEVRPPVNPRIIRLPLKQSDGIKDFFKRHSAIIRKLVKIKRQIMGSEQRKRKHDTGYFFPLDTMDFKIEKTFTSYTYWSQVPYPLLATKAKNISLATLKRIHKFLEKKSIVLLIVAIPYLDQVYVSDLIGPNYDANLPQKFVREFAHNRDIPFLDLLPLLREYVKNNDTNLYIPFDQHFSNNGHKLVGQYLAEWFMKEVEVMNSAKVF